jgi:hypothetical protein
LTTNPHQQFTPEYRVHELAHSQPGLADQEPLEHAGWVPHDGTALRDELLAQYRAAEPVRSWTEGLKAHAMDWAYNGMRSDRDTARDYGDHMVALFRAGEMTPLTSHQVEYPAFLADRQADNEPEPEA